MSVAPASRILMVCFGNLCRSPMAEALLAARLPAQRWRVCSAGTHAIGGDPPTPEAQQVIGELEDLDISQQRSTALTVDELLRSDHIFAMSRLQAAEVAALAPDVAGRTRLLGSFCPAERSTATAADPGGQAADPHEIFDPMGCDQATYRDCCLRLAAATDAVAAWLLEDADAKAAPPAVAEWGTMTMRWPSNRG